jgi:CheY-like chemotaxis protein
LEEFTISPARKILWIEDDALRLKGLIRPLEKDGYIIKLALDEKQAIKALDENDFDLILFDIIIPSGSNREEDYDEYIGVRLAKEIVEKRNVKVPILGISVVNRPEILDSLYELGFEKILPKGYVLPSELKKEVDKILGQ